MLGFTNSCGEPKKQGYSQLTRVKIPYCQGSESVQTVDGVGQLYDRQTGLPFTPRGNNFIRLAQENPYYGGTEVYHSLFNVGLYDPNDVENQLSRMQRSGYNTAPFALLRKSSACASCLIN